MHWIYAKGFSLFFGINVFFTFWDYCSIFESSNMSARILECDSTDETLSVAKGYGKPVELFGPTWLFLFALTLGTASCRRSFRIIIERNRLN
ncbi:hypothetical protein CVS40_1771 [Lucilia cuprina]|nr:hypothetical protein CVS40_1771 [Lucilia cuprina]